MSKIERKKKKKHEKHGSKHPPYLVMIQEAIISLKERKGSSRQAIMDYTMSNYRLKSRSHVTSKIEKALREGLNDGSIVKATVVDRIEYFRIGKDVGGTNIRSPHRCRLIGDVRSKAPSREMDIPHHDHTYLGVSTSCVSLNNETRYGHMLQIKEEVDDDHIFDDEMSENNDDEPRQPDAESALAGCCPCHAQIASLEEKLALAVSKIDQVLSKRTVQLNTRSAQTSPMESSMVQVKMEEESLVDQSEEMRSLREENMKLKAKLWEMEHEGSMDEDSDAEPDLEQPGTGVRRLDLMNLPTEMLVRIMSNVCDSYDLLDRCRQVLPLAAVSKKFYGLIVPIALEEVGYSRWNDLRAEESARFCRYLARNDVWLGGAPRISFTRILVIRVACHFHQLRDILEDGPADRLTELELFLDVVPADCRISHLSCPNVTSLTLKLGFHVDDGFLYRLRDVATVFPNVTDLEIHGAHGSYGYDHFVALAPRLRSLTFEFTDESTTSAEFSTKLARRLGHLTRLDLNLQIRYHGERPFGKAIAKYCYSLKELKVSRINNVNAFVKGLATPRYGLLDNDGQGQDGDEDDEQQQPNNLLHNLESLTIEAGFDPKISRAVIDPLRTFPRLNDIHLVLRFWTPGDEIIRVEVIEALQAAFPQAFIYE